MNSFANPFEILDQRLDAIVNQNAQILSMFAKLEQTISHTKPNDDFMSKYTSLESVYKRRIASKPTLYKLIHEGKLRVIKFGRKTYIYTEDFERLFRQIEVAA